MPRKTTQKLFEAFKEEFCHWQIILGLCEYHVSFSMEDIEDFAKVGIDAHNCVVDVVLCKQAPAGEKWDEEEARSTGKHEAVHLLLARLRRSAESRYVGPEEIEHEEERIVRVLEKIL